MKKTNSRAAREIRHSRLRRKVTGTASRPRLCVFRSLNHIYAQLIDDSKRHTLVSMSTLNPQVKDKLDGVVKTKQAEIVGTLLAKEALDKGIKSVVFDRGGYKYHGYGDKDYGHHPKQQIIEVKTPRWVSRNMKHQQKIRRTNDSV